MIERIKKIMEEEGMSSSKFADEIGIPGSRLSHYFSSRNKVSLELVTKILERFRGINSDWLLFGRGEMYKSAESKGANREPDLFSMQQTKFESIETPNEDDKSYDNMTNDDFFEAKTLNIEENGTSMPAQKAEYQSVGTSKNVHGSSREIEKIIVMYSDATFDCYSPNGSRL